MSVSMMIVNHMITLFFTFRCFLSKERADETSKTETSQVESSHHPHRHLVEDLDTKTEVILAVAVAVLVVFIVTW